MALEELHQFEDVKFEGRWGVRVSTRSDEVLEEETENLEGTGLDNTVFGAERRLIQK